ncbi:MAG: hypothetical protein M0Z58_00350 [Nitrospiraceae bacterium]|nr:hypothetical protein [Nitrospiraceae bacterium]
MKGLFSILVFVLGVVLVLSGAAMAQPTMDQPEQTPVGAQPEQTPAVGNAPISQPLVREGDFAVKLAAALGLGATSSESEAESTLSSAGIAPKNGWIADYPVTPDISGEVRAAIIAAADSGELPMGRDEALAAFQDVLAGYNLSMRAAGAGEEAPPPEETYPNTTVINNYYYSEGPPVITYFAPPPDYAYLYTWVPYPFWWGTFWFPGYYCLVDFNIVVFHHHHREFISNHFRNPRTGGFFRIDPTTRGFFTQRGARVLGPSARSGARSILGRSVVRPAPRTFGQFRGYGVTRPSPGTRSSAFEGWRSRQFEGAASTRGFRSRSRAGQLPARSFAPGGIAPGRAPSGGFEGFHGSGRFTGGGFRGGGGSRGGGFRR